MNFKVENFESLPRGCGLAAAGAGVALLAGDLPLALTLPGIALLGAPLIFMPFFKGNAGAIWHAYAWAWVWCCWFAAPPCRLRLAAFCLLALALAADAPRTGKAWKRFARENLRQVCAVIAAVLFLCGMRLASFGFTQSAGSKEIWEWFALGIGMLAGVVLAADSRQWPRNIARKMRLLSFLAAVGLAFLSVCRARAPDVQSTLDSSCCAAPREPAVAETADSDASVEELQNAAVVFGGRAACLRADVVPPAVARRGTRIRLELLWSWKERPSATWRVFAHVRRNLYGGVMYAAGADLPQADGEGPHTQTIDVEIPVDAPTGEYVVLMGLWNGRVNAHALRGGKSPADWAVGKDGRVRVARIRIEERGAQ